MRRALRPSKGDGVRLCLTLLPDEKVTKESPRGGSPLGTPLGGHYHPPSNASVAPPRKGCHPMQLNFPEDAADSLPPQPIPLGQKAGGSKGAEVKAERFYFRPLRRRSRNQEVPGESLVTFFSQESHPGHGAERPYMGLRGNAALSPQGKFVNKKNAPPPVRRKPSP